MVSTAGQVIGCVSLFFFPSLLCLLFLCELGLVITSPFSLNFVSSFWISIFVHSWLSNKLFPIFSSLPLQSHHHHHPTPRSTTSPCLHLCHADGGEGKAAVGDKAVQSSFIQLTVSEQRKTEKKTSIKLSQHQSSDA